MDKSKAKKAVKKAKGRKSGSKKEQPVVMAQDPRMAFNNAVNPEIQSAAPDMQPQDGYVNPYRALGTMVPTAYTPGNMLAGNNYPQMTGG